MMLGIIIYICLSRMDIGITSPILRFFYENHNIVLKIVFPIWTALSPEGKSVYWFQITGNGQSPWQQQGYLLGTFWIIFGLPARSI